VKEFLTSSRLAISSAEVSRFHVHLEPAHVILAKTCLGVLIRLDDRVDEDTVEDDFPLAPYAAEHWVRHAQFKNVLSHIWEEMEYLFDADKPCFSAWVRVHDIDVDPQESPLLMFSNYPSNRSFPSSLYYAALCGFRELVGHLIINRQQPVNADGGHFVSPLAAALGRGHLDVAQLLYEHGADVDVRGYAERTPLYGASCSGNIEIARWLLNRGAKLNFWDDYYMWTPLHLAAFVGHTEMTRLLLYHKADKNARTQNPEGEIPLHLASREGHLDIARLFLEHGVDVNVPDNHLSTPLHLASRDGQLEVARLLIENGANVDSRDSVGSTPLHLASRNGRINIARLLMENGASVDAKDNDGRTVFQVAQGQDKEIQKLLLEHDDAKA
jgi:ankyrin repeat protein